MTFAEAMTGAVRATEVLHLERIYSLEQCMSPSCTAMATWHFTTEPCNCVAPLCHECFKITKRNYERARQRLHPFARVLHPRCGARFRGRDFGYTYLRI
jgi:hypothetical protein